jgi:hypothetical protein
MANTHNPEYAQWVLDEIVEDDDFRARYREIDAVFDRFCTEADIAAAEEAAAYIDDRTEQDILAQQRQEMLDIWNS